jgi:uncharacterized protein YjbJ (UPF0337 family)
MGRRTRPHWGLAAFRLPSAVTTFVIFKHRQKELKMKTSTKDKTEGIAKDIAGSFKEAAGKAVGNPRLEADGKAEKVKGKVQTKVGEIEKVLGS